MKTLIVAAASLMLSTSAVALAQDAKPQATAADPAWAKPGAMNLTDGEAKPAAAYAIAAKGADGLLQTAALAPKSASEAYAEGKAAATGGEEVVMAHSGAGGPYEEVAARDHDLTPLAAQKNYVPCSPGPGDDHCIQLYERGVTAALASWDRPGGGLWQDHGNAATAMGGPYEPVEGEDAVGLVGMATNGDGKLDTAAGETGESEFAHHAEHAGVGGPYEAVAGYPPCTPGPGDDRCIQLYERGVTGAGN